VAFNYFLGPEYKKESSIRRRLGGGSEQGDYFQPKGGGIGRKAGEFNPTF